MRGIPRRTMSDVWWGRNKEKVIVKSKIKIIKERTPGLDENAMREIVRESTKDALSILAEEIANRAFRSAYQASPMVAEGDRVEIKTAFIDPTEEVDMEYNFERLGQVEKSQTDIQDAIKSLKKIKR